MKNINLKLTYRLAQLEAKVLDPVLFAVDDENQSSGVMGPAVTGAAIGAGGVGGYLGHQAIMAKYGVPGAGAEGILPAYQAAGADALAAVQKGAGSVAHGAGDAMHGAGDVLANLGQTVKKKLIPAAAEVLASTGPGLTQRLVELSGRLDEALAPDRAQSGLATAGIIGGGVVAGGAAAAGAHLGAKSFMKGYRRDGGKFATPSVGRGVTQIGKDALSGVKQVGKSAVSGLKRGAKLLYKRLP